MQLTEQHIIDRNDPRYAALDEAAFKSKNLYNAGNYEVRQSYIHAGKYLNYNEVQRRMQSHEAYKALPAKVSQQVLMQLAHDWESFFKARDAYNQDPSKFLGHPKLPKYKHKTEGRNLLVYTMQAISGGQTGGKKTLQRGIIKPSQLAITVKTKQKPTSIDQVRIVPRKGFYVVEIIYEKAVLSRSRKSPTPRKLRYWTWTRCQCMTQTMGVRSTPLAASGSSVDFIAHPMDARSMPTLTVPVM